MSVIVTTVAIPNPILGDWYGRGAERLAESLAGQCHTLIWNAARGPDLAEGRMYNGYISKPYALRESAQRADVAILCDASFYAIRDLAPMVDHIRKVGYYLCRNGASVGAWTSDSCLDYFGIERDEAMGMADVSSYCVGIDTTNPSAMELVNRWCEHSNRATIPGAHTNWPSRNRRSRNPGWVSKEKRVLGHRHDQSVLSIVVHEMGMMEWVSRPKYTAYKGSETEDTVLVCEGMQ